VTIAFNDKGLMTSGSWSDVGGFKRTDAFDARLMVGFFGDAVTLTMGTGSDHSLYDVYIDGSLWQSFNGYAAADGQVDILIPGQPQLAGDGPHLLEIRNRPERQTAGTTYRLRFKQLVVHDRSATLRTIQYTYDGLARLREARYMPGLRTSAPDADLLRRELFTFDRAGNRTQQSIALNGGAPTVTNYTYNAGNQRADCTYDANGNLLDGGSYTNMWDRANRLIGRGSLTFSYDGLGNRRGERGFINHLLDLQPGLALVLAATTSTESQKFVHGPRGLHAQLDTAGNWEYPIVDGLGSVRMVTDSNGNPLETRHFSSYGEPLDPATMLETSYGFTGEPRSDLTSPAGYDLANDLLYLRARYYDPMLGIFVSEDPLETANRYAYVGGNPVNRVDPTGLFDTSTCQVEAGDYLERIALQVGVIVNGRPLARGSSSASDIQSGWRAIWELNRNNPVNPLGNNPSLIRPGWQLALPPNRLGACTGGQGAATTTDCPPIVPIPMPTPVPIPNPVPPAAPCSGDLMDSNALPNLDAVIPPLDLQRIQSIGVVMGFSAAAPIWGAIGVGGGGSLVFMWDTNNVDQVGLDNCSIYFSPQAGPNLGADGRGVFGAVTWSTSRGYAGAGLNAGVSADLPIPFVSALPNINGSISRALGTCDYSFYAGLGTPSSASGSSLILTKLH
jgi:RHS repeat-associated protein